MEILKLALALDVPALRFALDSFVYALRVFRSLTF
jgi:hypothetical protein